MHNENLGFHLDSFHFNYGLQQCDNVHSTWIVSYNFLTCISFHCVEHKITPCKTSQRGIWEVYDWLACTFNDICMHQLGQRLFAKSEYPTSIDLQFPVSWHQIAIQKLQSGGIWEVHGWLAYTLFAERLSYSTWIGRSLQCMTPNSTIQRLWRGLGSLWLGSIHVSITVTATLKKHMLWLMASR